MSTDPQPPQPESQLGAAASQLLRGLRGPTTIVCQHASAMQLLAILEARLGHAG